MKEFDPFEVLSRSRALWNRSRFEIESDETLAQILDRGSIEDWIALYKLMSGEGDKERRLRERIYEVLHRAPTGYPDFWLAVLSGLGHPVDWNRQPKRDPGEAAI